MDRAFFRQIDQACIHFAQFTASWAVDLTRPRSTQTHAIASAAMAEPWRPFAARTAPLLGSTAAVLGVQLAGLAINFGLQILLARSLGTAEYGVYVYALRWLGLLTVLCQLGLAVGSLRFVPAYTATADWPHLKGFLRAGAGSVVTAAVLAGVFGQAALALFGGDLEPGARLTVVVALLALPIYALLQVWGASLRGLGQAVRSQLPAPVLRPVFLGIGVGAWWLAFGGTSGDSGLTAATAMALNLGAVTLALAILAGWLWQALPPALRSVEATFRWREWRRVMPPLMLQNLIGMVLQRLDVLLIGILLGAWEVALYAAASRVAGLLTLARKAVNVWAAPAISDLHARGRQEELADLVRQASRAIAGLSLVIGAVILLASRPVLLAFGDDFLAARDTLLILTAGHLAAACIGPASFLLSMTGGERTVVKVSTVVMLAGAGAYLALIPAWGAAGAAATAAATRFGFHLGLAMAARRRMGIRAVPF